jgi:membrane protein YqaA with SNARE-associated domain
VTVLIAALWGFGEATLFFIVPDVFLTVVALRDRRAALLCCGAAIAGALAGGLLLYRWGQADPAGATSALLAVPAIGQGMIQDVRSSLASQGFVALFLGPLKGTPYKIYAVASGDIGLSLPAFLLVSIPARGVRFLVMTLAASRASRGPLASWPLARKRVLTIALWTVFYTAYFALKRN